MPNNGDDGDIFHAVTQGFYESFKVHFAINVRVRNAASCKVVLSDLSNQGFLGYRRRILENGFVHFVDGHAVVHKGLFHDHLCGHDVLSVLAWSFMSSSLPKNWKHRWKFSVRISARRGRSAVPPELQDKGRGAWCLLGIK